MHLLDQVWVRVAPEEINHPRSPCRHRQNREIDVGEDEVDTVRFPRKLLEPIQSLFSDGGVGLDKADLTQRARFRYRRG